MGRARPQVVAAGAGARDQNQTAYQLTVSHAGVALWESGRVTGSQSAHVQIRAAAPLRSAMRYEWSVIVWASSGQRASANASFVTGLFARAEWADAEWLRGFGAQPNGTEPVRPPRAQPGARPRTL